MSSAFFGSMCVCVCVWVDLCRDVMAEWAQNKFVRRVLSLSLCRHLMNCYSQDEEVTFAVPIAHSFIDAHRHRVDGVF